MRLASRLDRSLLQTRRGLAGPRGSRGAAGGSLGPGRVREMPQELVGLQGMLVQIEETRLRNRA